MSIRTRMAAILCAAGAALAPAIAAASQDGIAREAPPPQAAARIVELMSLTPDGVAELERRAQGGDGRAMGLLGEAHGLGFGGLPPDEVKAAWWLRRAADAGIAWASTAAAYFELRATHGSALEDAGEALAAARATLQRAPLQASAPDRRLAALAEAGVQDAQLLLARQHETGRGAPADQAAAALWYARAAASGSGQASAALAVMLAEGRGIESDPFRALSYLAEAAARGVPAAQVRLAEHLLRGEAVSPDPVEAAAWLVLAARAGDPEAIRSLPALNAAIGEEGAAEATRRAFSWRRRAEQR